MNTQTIETTVPDYVLAKQELEAYYASLGLEHRSFHAGLCENADGWKHNAWNFHFHQGGPSQQIDYKTGIGIKETPEACEVLASAARDGWSIKSTNFEDWASEFGYETDSRKAEAIYTECEALLEKLESLLTEAQIEKLADLSSRL